MNQETGSLTVIAGANRGITLQLGAAPLLLGRDPDCDLVLLDGYASRQHCWVEPRELTWWLRDLGSRNGTLIGSERVYGERELHDGEIIVIGTTHIRFTDPTETHTYQRPPLVSRLSVDLPGHAVHADGKLVAPALSPKQWLLLVTLWQKRGTTVGKDEIANGVWPEAEGAIYDHQIDKLVSRLRARLGPTGDELIETVWGAGYRLRDE